MPRRVQDIVPADRRSVRDTSSRKTNDVRPATVEKTSRTVTRSEKIEKRSEKTDKTERTDKVEKPEKGEQELSVHRGHAGSRRMPVTPPADANPRRGNSRRKVRWLVAALGVIAVVAVAGYVASTRFSRASFSITPKVLPVSVNGTYVAQATPAMNGLGYEVVTLKGSASTTVPATDGPHVSTKASGIVTLYNEYAPQPVKLIAGTRLADSSGRIYRLTSTVLIPGFTKPGASIVPGRLNTVVMADEAGSSYNIGPTDNVSDFKIVAYQGSPRYDTVYARLSGAISGGFVGVKQIINPTLVASTTAILRTRLSAALFDQIKNAVPAGYILYDGSYASAYADPVTTGGNGSAILSDQAVVYGFIFKRDDILRAFAGSQATGAFGTFAFTAPGLENVSVAIANLKDYSPEKKTALIIHAKGNLKLVGTVPVDEIKQKLAGVPLSETQNIFHSYSPIIESGTGELVPPWAHVPKDMSRISVTVESP